MSKVYVAFTHTVHYYVDIEDEEIISVELPGWMNSFDEPEEFWNDDVSNVPQSDRNAAMAILETAPMPDPTWS